MRVRRLATSWCAFLAFVALFAQFAGYRSGVGSASGTQIVHAHSSGVATHARGVLPSAAPQASENGLTNPDLLNPVQQPLPNGSMAPDFALSTLDGKRYRLSSLRGHPVLLEFIALWCPHCQRMQPLVQMVNKQFAAAGERTLAILANPYGKNYDTSGGSDMRLAAASDIHWYQTTFHATVRILIDPTFATVNRYGAYSYPTIYVIDRAGVIRYSSYGEVPETQLAAAVSAALSNVHAPGTPAVTPTTTAPPQPAASPTALPVQSTSTPATIPV